MADATQAGGAGNVSTPAPDPAAAPAGAAPAGGDAAAPAFDADAVASIMLDKLSAGMQSRDPVPDKKAAAPVPASDPVADLIRPHFEPGLRSVQLEALQAKDAAVFYATTPEAAPYRDKIEGASKKLADAGSPFVREDIWKWYLGGNPEVADKIRKEKADTATARVAGATHVGPGSPPKQDVVKQATELSPTDLDKAMEGVSF